MIINKLMPLFKIFNYTCILASFTIILSCDNTTSSDNFIDIIKVEDYRVSNHDFEKCLKKLTLDYPDQNSNELRILLLDNFISAGLAIEATKKSNLHECIEYKEHLNRNIRQQIIRLKKSQYKDKITFNNSDQTLIQRYQRSIGVIDCIRIPKEYKKTSDEIYDYLSSGTTLSGLLDKPESQDWIKKGIYFGDEITLDSAIIPKKVVKKLMNMKVNELKCVNAKQAFFIIRLKQINSIPDNWLPSKKYLNNIKTAECIENGVRLLDINSFTTLVNYNNRLLKSVDFSIPPIQSYYNLDDEVIAVVGEYTISENEIKDIVYLLPTNIQSLFINKSTRTQAIATLALHLTNDNNTCPTLQNIDNYIQIILSKFNHELIQEDTITYIKNCLLNRLDTCNSTLLDLLNYNNQNIKYSSNLNQDAFIKSLRSISFDAWLTPNAHNNFNSLKINYLLAEKCQFVKNEIEEGVILVKDGDQNFKISDLNNELMKLTPQTRINIGRNNLNESLINNLAKNHFKNTKKLTTYNNRIRDIDVIGNSFDLINPTYNENDLLASVDSLSFTINEIRKLLATTQEYETKNLKDLKIRTNLISKLILDEVWYKLGISVPIDSNLILEKELDSYENYILSKLFYSTINVATSTLNNNFTIDLHTQKAIKDLNDHIIRKCLWEIRNDVTIRINIDFFHSCYSTDISSSAYYSFIEELKP